jgi:plastocyanin
MAAVLLAAFGALTAVGSAAAPSPEDVNAVDFSFSPRNITVDVGGTVTWHISGGPHTITAEGASFDSGSRSDGSVFAFTFSQPGSYAYSCQFHKSSGMTGVVEVRNAATTTTTTDPPPTTTTLPHSTTTTRPSTTTTTQPTTTTTTVPPSTTTTRPTKSAPLTPPVGTTPSVNREPAGKSHPSTTTTTRSPVAGAAAAAASKGHAHNSTTTGPPASMAPLPPLPVLGESPTPAPAPAPSSGSQVQLVAPAAARQPDGSPSTQSALIIGLGAIALVALGAGTRAWWNRSSRYWSA